MKKLNLNKEVIATLSDENMNRVEGGDDIQRSYTRTVQSMCPFCTVSMYNEPESVCICGNPYSGEPNTCMVY